MGPEILGTLHLSSCASWHDKAVFVQKKGYIFLISSKVPSTGLAAYLGGCSHSEGVLFPNLYKGHHMDHCNPGLVPFLHRPLSTHVGFYDAFHWTEGETKPDYLLPLARFGGKGGTSLPTDPPYQHLV